MASRFTIEYNVPIPPVNNGKRGHTHAIRQLAPGAFVRLSAAKIDNVRSLIYTLRKRGEIAGLRFTLRQMPEGGGVGVWCLAAQ